MKAILNIFRRLFILIWALITLIMSFSGGFILFPIFNYLLFNKTLEDDDPAECCFKVWYKGANIIDKIFDYLCDNKIKINKNSNFWK